MEADVYTLGVTLFLLLTGEFPTRQLIDEDWWSTSTTDDATEKDIPLDIYIKSKWYDFSDDLKELLQKMLSSYPSERPTIDEVIKSPWLSMPFNEELPYMVYEEMSARSSHKGSLSN
jgi:serine/threonine protein kinase